ncbi:hypothetical protein PSTG_00895 [Puccinia striiformis f. sp. tritici PST-78]|uniref:Uncharacterized protein n=1 Tax=Puccinia striiformis f. sp. tritici PST-78 TaxID=1165861 RepID=A0A0L0W312_9BASI|nr:hypothetical protein PSTG_00895 [Puccinia striiformis f. sp. tritici PST-78]
MTVTFGVAAQTNCPSTQPRAVCASKKDYNNPNTPVVQSMIKIEGVPCRDLTAQFDLSVPRCCKAEVAVGPNGQPATGGAFIVIKRGSIVYGTLAKPLNDPKQDCVLPLSL